MTKTIKLAVSAAMLLSASSAFATNGDNMIGQGAQSRAMGGVGIAKSFGANSALSNPALISSVDSMELRAAATAFMPNVELSSNAISTAQNFSAQGVFGGVPTATSEKSASDFSVIPEVAFAQKVTDNFTYGLAVFGTAGMGVEYKEAALAMMNTNLQLMKVAVPLAYSTNGFSVGVTPILQYGTLSIEYNAGAASDNGTSSDTGFGYEVGMAYDFKNAGVEGLTLGLVYKSELAMSYDKQISKASTDFGMKANPTTGVVAGLGDDLNQPAEMGVGIAYEIAGNTIAFDYRNVAWGDAKGYKDFNWENQSIFAVGYEYAADTWAVRAGFNHATSPIKEMAAASMNAGQYDGAAVNFFNMAGFPGIVENHATFGAGYDIMANLTLDAAVIYAPEVEQTMDTTAMTQGMVYNGTVKQAMAGGADQATATTQAGQMVSQLGTSKTETKVTHSQMGVTVALTYKF